MIDLKFLKKMSEVFGPSTAEDFVVKMISDELSDHYTLITTNHKNLIAYQPGGNFERTIVFQAHMDELGLRPYRYRHDGFIELTPTGGIPRNATNQMIIFYPSMITGVLVIADSGKYSRYFADIGAKDEEEALAMVPRFSNGAYTNVIMEGSPTQLMGKSFDDRAGCAAIVSALKAWDTDNRNRIIGVFTAREETGNWPVTELYQKMMQLELIPDLIVNVECCPGGPTPEDPNPLARLEGGIVLVNMDSSYEPDSAICQFMQELADDKNIANQHMAVRAGSGELGRLALGFGVAGYPLTIPCRYMHYPHSVISRLDYKACIEMILTIGRNYSI